MVDTFVDCSEDIDPVMVDIGRYKAALVHILVDIVLAGRRDLVKEKFAR